MARPSKYSHDATVKAITSFYEMLCRVHSDDAALLKYPPPTGWPQITHESFAGLGKTKEVIELLRHIPYLVGGPCGVPCILDSTRPIEYIDGQFCREVQRWPPIEPSEDHDEESLPGHIVSLAAGTSQRDGYTLLLDTKRGVVVLWKNDGNCDKWTHTSDADVYDLDVNPKRPDAWKCMPTYRIQTFFEFAKEQYRVINWMPDMTEMGRGCVAQVNDPESPGETDLKRRQIMIDAGWPGMDGDGTGWNKEQAEREMEENEELLW